MRQTADGIKILLIQHWSGNWSFPKGHMEKGEDERQTAIREIKEETGLDVVLDEKFKRTITYMPAKDTLKSVVFFVAHNQSGEAVPQPEEVKTLEWVDLEMARGRITHDKDKWIMTSAYTYIKRKYFRDGKPLPITAAELKTK